MDAAMGTRASDTATGSNRIDWSAIRDRVDLARVATALFGPAPGRRGERGRKLYWLCPFHQDRNPSFCVDPSKPRWWKCWGCGEHGDAANLVMRLKGWSFPEAVRWLAEQAVVVAPSGNPARQAPPPQKPPAATAAKPAERSSGLSAADAQAFVSKASERLWQDDELGRYALGYLRGPRGLTDETIRAARLGCTLALAGFRGAPRGWVIPWFDGDRLTLVKIRQPDPRDPPYYEIFRDRPGVYPSLSTIRPGRPLIVVEGEFDALLLAQELASLDIGVVTLGSASARPEGSTYLAMLAAPVWFIATDNDDAGNKAAEAWPDRARRVRPPTGFKDWTEAHRAGIDLRRWWEITLGLTPLPDLGSCQWWEEALHLERFLDRLQARGIRLDGELVRPQIKVGTCTGRVTYSDPPLQGTPKEERSSRLGPVISGRVFICVDYGQIEPRILHFLLRKWELIDWEPGADLYLTLAGDQVDRDKVKTVVNSLINGGASPPGVTGRLAEFVTALDIYLARVAEAVKFATLILTLAHRPIPLDIAAENRRGKLINRVVQGTAADIFNRAVLCIDAALEGLPAAVAYLLFDEMWIETDPSIAPQVVELVRREMEGAALSLGITVPVRLEQEEVPGPWYVGSDGVASRERPTESSPTPAPMWPSQPAVAKPPIPPKGQGARPAGVASTHDEPPGRLDPDPAAPPEASGAEAEPGLETAALDLPAGSPVPAVTGPPQPRHDGPRDVRLGDRWLSWHK
jgi:hypothetical protein